MTLKSAAGAIAAAPPESTFQAALRLRKHGEAARADALCAELLRTDPNHFHAHHLRGLLAIDRGEIDFGIECIARSLAINPDQSLALSNLGNALLDRGDPRRALECLERALRLKPDLAIALYNRGNALKALGRVEEALDGYDRVLRIDGGHALALNNRGLVLQQLGRLEDARDSFARAAESAPALAAPRKNLAWVLLGLARPHEALAIADRLLDGEPDDPRMLGARGNALLALGRHEPALACYDTALALAPDDVNALVGRGSVLLQLGRGEAAALAFETLLAVQPDNPVALGHLHHHRLSVCDWRAFEEFSGRVARALRGSRIFGNPLLLLVQDDPESSRDCARAYVQREFRADDSLGPCPPPPVGCDRDRIRIAYVSADFNDHPVSHLLAGVLERHDRERFEIIGVPLCARNDTAMERRVFGAFDRCIDAVGHGDRDVAIALRRCGVDIAVDLMGFTVGSRLGIFAHRAARVQVGFLGYAGTVGAPFMDYLVADPVVVPPGCEAWYEEAVVRLPDCYLPTDDRRPIATAPTREQAGLPAHGFIFCAFTQPHKITPSVFDVWMRLLKAVDGSILWLRDMGSAVRANLEREACLRGVDAHRLVFAPRVPSAAQHLARLALADLYLDTTPYNAHSTACDALWTGVPVITCAGKGFASRVAASALGAAGVPELVTGDLGEYAARALEFVRDPLWRGRVRAHLRARNGRLKLFDTARYATHLERAYRTMHERALIGAGPVRFAVEPEPGFNSASGADPAHGVPLRVAT